MNYIPYMTLLGWETRNWRHRDRALVWCKDYGFVPVTKHVFIGEIYANERSEIDAKFNGLFKSKTERFFFVVLCKSCFNESMVSFPLKKKTRSALSFELVQIPKNP